MSQEIIKQTFVRAEEGYHLARYEKLEGDQWVAWDGKTRNNLISINHVNIAGLILRHHDKIIQPGEVTQFYRPYSATDLVIEFEMPVPPAFPRQSVERKMQRLDISQTLDVLAITFTLFRSNFRLPKLFLASFVIAGMATIVWVGAKIFKRPLKPYIGTGGYTFD